MYARTPLPPVLERLAMAQAGVVSREQASALLPRQVQRRLVACDQWRILAPGIYQVGVGEASREARLWASLLLGGQGAVLGLHTAAELWELEPAADPITVWVPRGRHAPAHDLCRFLRTTRPVKGVGTLTRTTVPATVLDLCRSEPDSAVQVVTQAVTSRRTTPQQLLAALDDQPQMPRRRLLVDLLQDVDEGAVSALELLYMGTVERPHGLPRAQRQHRRGTRIRDLRIGRLLVELDGRLGHTGAGAFRDMRRDNEHLLGGESTLRFGWHDCSQNPCEVAAMVHRALLLLGEPSQAHACANCRAWREAGWDVAA